MTLNGVAGSLFHQEGLHKLVLHKRPGWFIDKVSSEMIGFCKSKQEFPCIMCPLIHMGVAIFAPFVQKNPDCLFLLWYV